MGSTNHKDVDALHRVWEKGAVVPETIHDCVHNLVSRTVMARPLAQAICAWDGELTYKELDGLARKLAEKLIQVGVSSGDIVPVCFEKSVWTGVAVLGVIKAGAGFVLLDHHLPEERLRTIVRQTQSKVIVSSHLNGTLSSTLLDKVVIVGSDLAKDGGSLLHSNLPAPDPSSVVYVIFTSGSTGTPKGCVISHQNLSSALHHQMQSLDFKPTSRIYDFASYSFDLAVQNLFAAWIIGGCVCVPNEADRMNHLVLSMNQMKVTHINLTPTVARLLSPGAVPTLETLILLGEIVTEHDSQAWWGSNTKLINAYGPTECTSLSTVNCTSSSAAMLRSIGVGKGAVTWIVDPKDHNILMSWGQIGELIIEGPIVGLGYLDDPEKTAAAFIDAPSWLLQGSIVFPGRQGRLYKTGDLVQFDDNGNIIIIGRKDTQVKIRGHRIELGEVECRVRDCLPNGTQIVAETILPTKLGSSRILAVFVGSSKNGSTRKVIEPSSHDAKLLSISKTMESELAKHLPAYMIPSLYFSIPEIPLTETGKTNRKLLREIGTCLLSEIAAAATDGEKPMPQTEDEHTLQDLWAQVLNIARDNIGTNDSFLRLGGDSITAMKLVREARLLGIKLTVADIFQQPVLSDLSQLMRAETNGHVKELPPHNVLEPEVTQDIILSVTSSCPNLHAEDIADILPLTDMQKSFVVEGLSQNLQYVDYYHLELGPKVDMKRLKESCGKLLDEFPILRASFWPYKDSHFAVIPKSLDVPFQIKDVQADLGLEEALKVFCLDDIATFGRRQTIIHFIVLRHQTEGMRLIMRISHSQYDAISVEVIFKALVGAYHGEPIPELASYSKVLAHVKRQRASSIKYFRTLLKGAKYVDFKVNCVPREISEPIAVPFRIENEISTPNIPSNITMASFMSSAWAVFLCGLLSKDDIVYGQLVNGRNLDVPTIEDVVGCCINVVPVRVNFSCPSTLYTVIQSVQGQFASLGEAGSLGFSDTVQSCTDWPPGSSIFSCAMHQNVDENLTFEIEDGFEGRVRRFENHKRLPIFLYMLSLPRGGRLGVQIFAHSHMISLDNAQILLNAFCCVVEKLGAALGEPSSVADLIKNMEIPVELISALDNVR